MAIGRLSIDICNNEPVLKVQCKIQDFKGILRIYQLIFDSLVLDYNPILPDIQRVIQRHVHLLRSSSNLLEIFPSISIFPACRRTKNLKEILAPSKFGGDG